MKGKILAAAALSCLIGSCGVAKNSGSTVKGNDNRQTTSWTEKAEKALGYSVTNNFDANNCEFYIDGSYGESFSHNGAGNNNLTFYLQINNDLGGKLLNGGAYVHGVEYTSYSDASEKDFESVGIASENKLAILIYYNNLQDRSYVKDFALFIDVKRANGSIDRLWLNNSGKNFSVTNDISGHTIGETSGVTYKYYIGEESSLFNQKKACKK